MKKDQAIALIRLFAILAIVCLFVVNTVFSGIDTVFYPLFPPNSQVKNIVILIGDGMGLAQIAATRIKTFGADGRLNMEKMPITGIVNTHAGNSLVTCSAAAGTALATGLKTNIGMISINPEGNKLRTILEACKEKEMATGLVVTSTITHATPAVFASHVKSRKDEANIALQLLENKVNVLLGGGKAFFVPQSERKSKRKDDIDLIALAKIIGYSFIQSKEELMSATGNYVLGLFQLNEMTTKPPEPSLAEMTGKAIELLSRNSNGFFLMVEGSQIDWACHDNDDKEAIRQTQLFDEAVQIALEFALKDKYTLVIVTADHETGGMGIKKGSLDGKDLDIEWITDLHSGIPVILYAFGPHAEQFSGVYDNTEVPRIFAKLLGIQSFPKIIEELK